MEMEKEKEKEKKMVVLKSSDGEKFEVEEAVVMKSERIKKMIEEGYADDHILLPKVTGKILAMIIQFCMRHVDDTTANEDELKVFDTKFVQVDHQTLFAIILAANDLNIKSLLKLTCQTVADIMKGMFLDGIVKNDFTPPEEEEEICREKAQAFE